MQQKPHLSAYKLKCSKKKFVHCARFWIGVNRKKNNK